MVFVHSLISSTLYKSNRVKKYKICQKIKFKKNKSDYDFKNAVIRR